ncbi:MAG: hypothetical protein Q4P34_05035 [Tissierellia bacterium]|nr:hypothetical protein [Tissierellia bacterium]
MKKLFSLALAFAIIFSVLPAGATSEQKVFKNNIFSIDEVSTDPKITTNGENFLLKLKVTNISGYDIKGAVLDLREVGPEEGKPNRYFILSQEVKNNTAQRAFELANGNSVEFQYVLMSKCDLGCSKYPLTLSFKFADKEFVDRVYVDVYRDSEYQLPTVGDGPEGKPDIIESGLPVLPQGTNPYEPFPKPDTDGDKDVNQPDKDKPDADKPDKDKPDADKAPNGDNADADKPGGDSVMPDIPIYSGGSSIMPSGGDTGFSSDSVSLSGDKIKNKPKLIIDKYGFSPENPMAGEEFTMNLSFYNTNADKSVRNIKIFLTSTDQAVDANPNENRAPSSSVFTPVDSSNTFFISYIAPGGTVQKAITLTTSNTLAAKNYQVTANFEYEDKDGNEYTAQELIGIPIVQKSKLETSELTLPTETFMGEPADGSIEFYNTGKDTLYNLMVKLQGEFDTDSKQYYVGNFQSGSSDSFQFDIRAKNPGETKGKIIFEYEDSTGHKQEVVKEFALNTLDEPMPNPEDMGELPMDGDFDAGGKPKVLNPFLLGGILLAVAIIVAVVLKKRKAKKEDEDLKIDED